MDQLFFELLLHLVLFYFINALIRVPIAALEFPFRHWPSASWKGLRKRLPVNFVAEGNSPRFLDIDCTAGPPEGPRLPIDVAVDAVLEYDIHADFPAARTADA
jgi:hypothetical protein